MLPGLYLFVATCLSTCTVSATNTMPAARQYEANLPQAVCQARVAALDTSKWSGTCTPN